MIVKSLCPICYKEIDGTILVNQTVEMLSKCPTHGDISGIVEVDTEFFNKYGTKKDSCFFNSVMLDITDVCNTKCRLCYYPVGKDHKSASWVLDKGRELGSYNLWLSGGEPTTHPEIFDIISKLDNFSCCLTNGVKFADKNFLNEYIKASSLREFLFVKAVISIHSDASEAKFVALDNIRSLGIMIDTAMFAIESVDEIEDIIDIWEDWHDVIACIRIRTPFNTWMQEEDKGLYLSQMDKEFTRILPQARVTDLLGGNTIYNLNYSFDKRFISLCCSPSRYAMDINGVDCAPKMLCKNNKIYPIPLGLMINEGINKGQNG